MGMKRMKVVRHAAYVVAGFIIYMALRYLIMGAAPIEDYSFWFGFAFAAICNIAYAVIFEVLE